MTTHKIVKRVLRCFTAGLVACIFGLLGIPLYGWCWHVLHGNSIYFENWTLPVPKGYFVRDSHDGSIQKRQYGPTMWKLTLGAPLLNTPSGHLSFYSRKPLQPFFFERDYPRFKAGLFQSATEEGFQLTSEREVPVGNSIGRCLEFGRTGVASEMLVTCAIENSVVVAFYDGDSRYSQDFFDTLRGMAPHTPNSR